LHKISGVNFEDIIARKHFMFAVTEALLLCLLALHYQSRLAEHEEKSLAQERSLYKSHFFNAFVS